MKTDFGKAALIEAKQDSPSGVCQVGVSRLCFAFPNHKQAFVNSSNCAWQLGFAAGRARFIWQPSRSLSSIHVCRHPYGGKSFTHYTAALSAFFKGVIV